MMNLTVVTAQKHGLIITLDPDGVVVAVAVKVIHDFVSVNKCQIRQGLGRSHLIIPQREMTVFKLENYSISFTS